MNDIDTVNLIYSGRMKAPSEKVEIEVLLEETEPLRYRIREDETSPLRWIPRQGIKVLSRKAGLAVLEMSEGRAIALNLI